MLSAILHVAHAQPNRRFLLCGEREATYAQTFAAAGELGRLIRERGWGGVSRPVAVCTHRPEALFHTIAACLVSGTSLAFCQGCSDVAQIGTAMGEVGAHSLLTDIPELLTARWAVSLPDALQPVLALAARAEAMPDLRCEGEGGAAFLFQTSGTAGEPKWVECPYEKCLDVVECMWREGFLDHARGQTVFLTAPLHHSLGLSTLLEYSRAGASIALPSGDSPLGSLGDLRSERLAHEVTAIEGVPHLHVLLAKLADRLALPRLRHLGFGGGGIDLQAVRELQRRFPHVSYSVRYGLTETPSVVSQKIFRPAHDDNWASSGRLLSIYEVTIVDEAGRVLAAEQEGEIVVGGACVARYVGQDPREVDGRLHTGDIGYLSGDGELFVVGRRSAFLKRHGYRLSPELIEAAARTASGAEECRALMRDGRLVLEVQCHDWVAVRQALLSRLPETLPPHAIPDEIVRIENIPRTRSGKLRRH